MMTNHKSWNIRDQTEENLRKKAEKLYEDIARSYKMLKRLSNKEDAKKMIDSIWSMKAMANEIQLELLRREYADGTQNANE